MNGNNQISIELAKSWFVMAQISMMLAGFLFLIATTNLTNTVNKMNEPANIANKLLSDVQNDLAFIDASNNTASREAFRNMSYNRLDIAKIQISAFEVFFKSSSVILKVSVIGGFACVIASILFFIIGRRELKRTVL